MEKDANASDPAKWCLKISSVSMGLNLQVRPRQFKARSQVTVRPLQAMGKFSFPGSRLHTRRRPVERHSPKKRAAQKLDIKCR